MHFFRPLAPIINKIVKLYTSRERKFSFQPTDHLSKKIIVKVKPGVFHPGLFMSTKILLKFVDGLNINQKTFLELGAGTGIISILAARNNAVVYASDISSLAVENIRINADENEVEINVLKSDLFDDFPKIIFDYLVINPPYYTKDPETEEQFAWYCGKNFEFFRKLFVSLSEFINQDSKVFMILSEVCDIEKIKSIGEENYFTWELVYTKTVWGEKNFIYQVVKN